MAGDLEAPIGIELFQHAEGFETSIEAFGNPVQLAELSFVALHGDPTDGRRRFRNGLARSRPATPWRILINPRAQQPDLSGGERLAFALRRHLHVGDEPRDVMDERALGALAESDGRAFRAALQQLRAIIHTELALRLLRSVALEAGRVEDRFDVAGKIDPVGRGGRKFRYVHVCGEGFGAHEQEGQ